MAAEIVNLYIEQGADYSLDITLKDDLGVPYDLDLYTLVGNIRIDNTGYSIDFSESVDGVVTISLPWQTTQVMQNGVGRYDIYVQEDATNKRDRLLEGRVYIDKRVS